AAEAAEHIFLVDAGPPTEGNDRGGYSRGDLEAIRPAAFIDFPPPELQDDEVFMAPRIGSGFHAHYGRLNIAIDDDVPAELEGKFAQSKLRFLEYLGRLLIDLEEMSDRGNYLIIGNLQLW